MVRWTNSLAQQVTFIYSFNVYCSAVSPLLLNISMWWSLPLGEKLDLPFLNIRVLLDLAKGSSSLVSCRSEAHQMPLGALKTTRYLYPVASPLLLAFNSKTQRIGLIPLLCNL